MKNDGFVFQGNCCYTLVGQIAWDIPTLPPPLQGELIVTSSEERSQDLQWITHHSISHFLLLVQFFNFISARP